MINGLLELLTTKKWMMQPEALDAFRHIIQQNLSGHIAVDVFDKKQPYMATLVDGSMSAAPFSAGMPDSHDEHPDHEPTPLPFVAILPVCGPITRNGDACSYGSVDLRDAVMEASDQDDCKGIIFYINTPGGACSAVPDFKYAINYAHECGKKVFAFVDGMAASCGMYLAALCDKRYYMNAEDQIGSIGVMAAFWTSKDGDVNQYTNETFHELYATQSTHKNKWYRDAAEGDYTELQADLDKTCEQFHADVLASCPNAKPEHLDGTLFDARDIDGILMDGQRTLNDVIDELINGTGGSVRNGSAVAASDPVAGSMSAEPAPANSNTNNIDMNNYPLINAALGMEEGTLVVEEAGTHLDATLLDTLEAHLAEQAKQLADAQAKAAELESGASASADELANIKASLKETEEQLATAQADKEAADKALTDANEAHTQALADAQAKFDTEKAELAAGLATAQSDLEGAKASLATAEQTIADRDAQIAALTAAPAPAQPQGSAPANNGTEASEETPKTDYPVWDGKESMVAFKARRDAWHQAHNC